MDDVSIQISGMKARLDGVESAIERLQEYKDELEMQIAALQGHRANGNDGPALQIRTVEPMDPRKKDHRGWPDDPAERRAEALRRREAAAAKKKAAAYRAGAKKRWGNMTVRQQKEHLKKMQKGRRVAVKKTVRRKAPVVKNEAAAAA